MVVFFQLEQVSWWTRTQMAIFSGCACCVGLRPFVASGLAVAAARFGSRQALSQSQTEPAAGEPPRCRTMRPYFLKSEPELAPLIHERDMWSRSSSQTPS